MAGIAKDEPRGGRRPTRRNKVARLIVERTTQTVPNSATHWSVRMLANELRVSPSMVHRVWKANGLKPHLTRIFKVSNDSPVVAENNENPKSFVWTTKAEEILVKVHRAEAVLNKISSE